MPPLGAREVHVWSLDLQGAAPAGFEAHLAPEECARAARFVFERDRHRYLRARLALREILGAYLGTAAREVPLVEGEHGKPALGADAAPGFNLSHSEGRGLVAVARAPHVGVDLEAIDPARDLAGLARSVFTPAELEAFERTAAPERARAFFIGWTRKEACLKALGTGFTLEPTRVDAGIEPDRRRVAVEAAGERFVEVASIMLEAGHVAAVAVGAGFDATRLMEWPRSP